MRACIVAVGTEMLTPFRVDTNSLFITERLNQVGIDVRFKLVAGDDVEELAPVFCGPAGLGGDLPRAGDAALDHLVAADRERADRALDRRIGQPAGGRHALAEPDDAGERVDDAKPIARRPRDQQAAVVGAEI